MGLGGVGFARYYELGIAIMFFFFFWRSELLDTRGSGGRLLSSDDIAIRNRSVWVEEAFESLLTGFGSQLIWQIDQMKRKMVIWIIPILLLKWWDVLRECLRGCSGTLEVWVWHVRVRVEDSKQGIPPREMHLKEISNHHIMKTPRPLNHPQPPSLYIIRSTHTISHRKITHHRKRIFVEPVVEIWLKDGRRAEVMSIFQRHGYRDLKILTPRMFKVPDVSKVKSPGRISNLWVHSETLTISPSMNLL